MFKILRADFQADFRTNANNSLRRALSESVVNNVYHWTPQACSATPSVAMSSNDCGAPGSTTTTQQASGFSGFVLPLRLPHPTAPPT